MWYEKLDKLTAFVLVLAIAASVGMYIKSRYTSMRHIAKLEFATEEDKKRYSEIVDIIDGLLKKKCYALLSSAKYNAYIAK